MALSERTEVERLLTLIQNLSARVAKLEEKDIANVQDLPTGSTAIEHSHQSVAEGGQLAGDVIGDDVEGETEDASHFTITLSKYQAGNYYPALNLTSARGTIASPAAVQAGDWLGLLGFYGFDTSVLSRGGWMGVAASETWSGSAHGTTLFLFRRLTGTIVDKVAIQLDANGNTYFNLGDAAGVDKLRVRDSANAEVAVITSDGELGLGTSAPGSILELNLATEDLEIVDAGSAAATEQDWIEVQIGGNAGYIRVFAAK